MSTLSGNEKKGNEGKKIQQLKINLCTVNKPSDPQQQQNERSVQHKQRGMIPLGKVQKARQSTNLPSTKSELGKNDTSMKLNEAGATTPSLDADFSMDQSPTHVKRLFIQNFPDDTTKQDVLKFFRKFGISEIDLKTGAYQNAPIEFINISADKVEDCLAKCQKKKFKNTTLSVQVVEERLKLEKQPEQSPTIVAVLRNEDRNVLQNACPKSVTKNRKRKIQKLDCDLEQVSELEGENAVPKDSQVLTVEKRVIRKASKVLKPIQKEEKSFNLLTSETEKPTESERRDDIVTASEKKKKVKKKLEKNLVELTPERSETHTVSRKKARVDFCLSSEEMSVIEEQTDDAMKRELASIDEICSEAADPETLRSQLVRALIRRNIRKNYLNLRKYQIEREANISLRNELSLSNMKIKEQDQRITLLEWPNRIRSVIFDTEADHNLSDIHVCTNCCSVHPKPKCRIKKNLFPSSPKEQRVFIRKLRWLYAIRKNRTNPAFSRLSKELRFYYNTVKSKPIAERNESEAYVASLASVQDLEIEFCDSVARMFEGISTTLKKTEATDREIENVGIFLSPHDLFMAMLVNAFSLFKSDGKISFKS